MKLKDILSKDINRAMDGVIKADDDSRVMQEVEEYVLTDEIAKQLERLVEDYLSSAEAVKKNREPHPVNGVWISGYFGSGKSHLLKILAWLLENRDINGSRLKERFLPKVRDQFLKANLSKAIDIPSKSILFNIDQLADASRVREENVILLTFEKVFNRLQGYFYENRAVAEFERHLDEEGQFAEFAALYEKNQGEAWQSARRKAFGLGRAKTIEALSKFRNMKGNDAGALLDHYKNETGLSVEGFALRVRDWLDAAGGPEYRLNFFIDEVGQFIGQNSRLMLNLQTISETLATVCGGRVWIFVTSQEDLNAVIGDSTLTQTFDFSKINARFKRRVSLSSADVQEVIEKRLLDKTDEGTEKLGLFYMKEKESLKTIFSFRQGGEGDTVQGQAVLRIVLSIPGVPVPPAPAGAESSFRA